MIRKDPNVEIVIIVASINNNLTLIHWFTKGFKCKAKQKMFWIIQNMCMFSQNGMVIRENTKLYTTSYASPKLRFQNRFVVFI